MCRLGVCSPGAIDSWRLSCGAVVVIDVIVVHVVVVMLDMGVVSLFPLCTLSTSLADAKYNTLL